MPNTVPAIKIHEGEIFSPGDDKIAIPIRAMSGWRGDAKLYRVTPPIADDEGDHHDYVVVSAAVTPDHGAETYIFAADANGEIVNWMELPGSLRGDLDHEAALSGAGYDIRQPETPSK